TFSGYWDYDGGGIGDMGQDYRDPVQDVTGKDAESPVTFEVDAPKQNSDAAGTGRNITYTYPDGCQLALDGAGTEEGLAYIEGPKGKLYKAFVSDIPDMERKLAQYPDPAPQMTDFVEACRTRQKFALNEQNGYYSPTLVNLGLAALRLNRTLKFDSDKQVFVDDEAANRLIDQPMRGPWII